MFILGQVSGRNVQKSVFMKFSSHSRESSSLWAEESFLLSTNSSLLGTGYFTAARVGVLERFVYCLD